MFCYTYNPLLILSTNFFIVLCILCMGRGTCALAYVIRSSGLFVTVFRKTFSDFPKPYAEYFHLFAHKQTRKSVIREAKCAHEKKHKPPPSPIGNGWGGVPYSCVRVRYQLSR